MTTLRPRAFRHSIFTWSLGKTKGVGKLLIDDTGPDSEIMTTLRSRAFRHSIFTWSLEQRIRVYGRVFDAKRFPTSVLARARTVTALFPLMALPHSLGFFGALGASCVVHTFRFFPSD